MRPGDAALGYARRGWRLFPCDVHRHPITQHGFKQANSDPAIIRKWWRAHPDALIGFWSGPSDIAVLDVDMKNGIDGLATFARLDGCPILPPTPTVRTPRGGWHLHYRMPADRISATVGAAGRGIGVGLDWRGDGGYAILPTPGSAYRWDRWHYGNCAPLPVPSALMPKPLSVRSSASSEVPKLGAKNLAGTLRFLMTAAEGSRNSSLFWASCRFAEAVAADVISESDARALLLHVANALGLPGREIVATITSAFMEHRHG